MMQELYYIIDSIIKDEIDQNQTIAIYPLGKIGLMAKDILNNRYGRKGIVIDNNLYLYNNEIVNIEQFGQIDNEKITILLATDNRNLSKELKTLLYDKEYKAKVRDIFDINGMDRCGPNSDDYFNKIVKLCSVKKVVGHELVRVGGNNDGAYVMLDDFDKSHVAYSFGIGNNISWDESVAARNVKVYCYDHTIECLPETDSDLLFYKIGISCEDCINKKVLSLDTIFKINNHENEENMILKMDVEGAEWDFLQSVPQGVLRQFSQITLELHDMTDSVNKERVIYCLEKLNNTHQSVWIHGNNAGEALKVGNIVIPSLLEITFVNRNLYEFVDTDYRCPSSIDQPNIKDYPEIVLNWE